MARLVGLQPAGGAVWRRSRDPSGVDAEPDARRPRAARAGPGGRPRWRAAAAARLDGALNLVVLFAAWCPPCRVEMPPATARGGARGLGSTCRGHRRAHPGGPGARRRRLYLGEAKITFPTFLIDDDAYEGLEDLARKAGGPGLVLPTVFVVDRERRLLAVYRGREVRDAARGAAEPPDPCGGSAGALSARRLFRWPRAIEAWSAFSARSLDFRQKLPQQR